MLPSGLAIYETKLSPHHKGMNFVLGGPHASFDHMLARSGNAAFLRNQFIDGLNTWRTSGPPSLTQYVMNQYEVNTATVSNMLDDDFAEYKKLMDTEVKECESLLDELDNQREQISQQSSRIVLTRQDRPVSMAAARQNSPS